MTAVVQPELRWTLPAEFRQPRESAWARVNMRSRELGCFLEGPSFDSFGNLFMVDIPFGRIFRIAPGGEWQLHCEYDGWPNGLKLHRDGRIFLADYRRGILHLAAGRTAPEEVATSFHSEGFRGCNDLFFAGNGDLWFTDQGQSGLQEPSGRVFRRSADGTLTAILTHVPSPNGLVMNLDETQLLLAVTRCNAIWRLPLMEDGSTSKVGLFIQLSGGIAGPDGLALDAEGGLVVAHPGIGVWRFDRVGRPTHLVESPEHSVWTNIAFGGSDDCDLHIVDSLAGSIWCARMPCPGKRMYSGA
jgi:gluconolactonase